VPGMMYGQNSGLYVEPHPKSGFGQQSGPGLILPGKTLEQINQWVNYDMQFWEMRNQRFQRDQELYKLTRPDNLRGRNDADLIVLPDPKILVKKVARLLARHPNVIEVPASPNTPDTTIAQRIENFCYSWDQSINQRWQMGLNNPYRYDQAFYLVLRGWLCERTMLYPEGEQLYGSSDPANIWRHEVVDPANVYPYTSGGEIRRVSHTYASTVGQLRYDPFYQGGLIQAGMWDEDDRRPVMCHAVYWKDLNNTWWHAVTISHGMAYTASGSEWIKPPTELGYNPWTITIANGASYRSTPWDDQNYVEEIGTSVLDESSDTFKYLNRMATKLSELLSLEANPPLSIYSGAGEIKKVSFEPGARNFLAEKDRLEAHRVGPAMGDYQMLWDLLMQRASRAGLPSAFFAEYGGESGFSASVILAAGKDVLFPWVEAVNLADAMKYRKVLEIYRDFGPASPLQSFMPADSQGHVTSAQITASDIYQQGTFVKITREDMTPQEYASRINTGLAMVEKKAISLETFRRDFAKIQNPKAENQQVLSELVYMNEGVVAQLIPLALTDTGQQMLAQLYSMVQNGMIPQGLPDPNQPQPPGGPPGPPGPPPPPGQPPGPQPQPAGLPSHTLPPIMQQGNLQTNSQVAQGNPHGADINSILQLINGGARGGSGAGGTPPPPGSRPVPLTLPPGRR
jgi:hypothetical protein